MSATDEKTERAISIFAIEPMSDGESVRTYFERTSEDPLTPQEEETISALERIQQIWNHVASEPRDSTSIIRRDRDTNHERSTIH